MQKIFLIIYLLFISSLSAAVISGNQGQVSIEGGSMTVSSGGKSVNVNSGEITFTKDGSAPTAPRRINANDMKNFNESMDAGDPEKLVNIKYPANLKPNLIKHLQIELVQKGIPKDAISVRKTGQGTEIRINEVDIEKIKSLYPPYYKLVENYYKKKKSTKKIPTLNIKNSHLKRYHKALFIKYGR